MHHESSAPVVGDILFFLVFRTNHIVNMVTQFVIEGTTQTELAPEWEPQECSWIGRECFVDTDFNPRPVAFPPGMISTQNERLVELTFSRFGSTRSVLTRKGGLVCKNYAI